MMRNLNSPVRDTNRFVRFALILLAGAAVSAAQAPPPVTRAVGSIRNVAPDSITVTPDSGAEITATLSAATKILRVPPGEKDLKNAIPLQAQDLQPGDRVLIRGQAAAEGKPIAALSVIVMKQADVSAKQEHDREDWQKRGVGGLVSAIDLTSGNITVSSGSFGATHNVVVHTTKATVSRRYSPGSVKFDEARPAPLDQIRPGDQLRARGARSADGAELTAEEIVSGTFRNIAGTIVSIDSSENSLTVQDAIAKAPVVVRLTPDSQIKKLPPEMAQRIAMRLKAGNGEAPAQSPTGPASGGARPATTAPGPPPQYARGPGGPQGNWGGPPDFQHLLGRLPSSKLSDLQKGDALMIVATAAENSSSVTAITLLGGVEPILTASPSRNAAMLLSPWSLGGGAGEGEGGGPQ